MSTQQFLTSASLILWSLGAPTAVTPDRGTTEMR